MATAWTLLRTGLSAVMAIVAQLRAAPAALSRCRQSGEERGKPLQQVGGVAGDMHGLVAAFRTADEREIAARHAPAFRQQRQQRVVGTALRAPRARPLR